MLSVLSHLFVTERHRPKASNVGHAVPYLSEVDVASRAIEPLLVTNLRGEFVRTRVSKSSYVRFAYTELDWDKEPLLLQALHAAVVQNSIKEGWENVVDSIPAAIARMADTDFRARVVVSSDSSLQLPSDVTLVNCDLPTGIALVFAHPVQNGTYTRIRNHVGVIVQNVSSSITAVV